MNQSSTRRVKLMFLRGKPATRDNFSGPYGMFQQPFFSAYFSKDWKSFTNSNLIFVNDKNTDALHMGVFPEGRWTIHGCFSYLSELLICAEDL